MNDHSDNWITFELSSQLFGIRSTLIREMIVLGKIDKVAKSPDHVRGITTRRGRTVLAIDLRKWLGMKSKTDEIQKTIDILDQREQDHINWLNELKSSTLENRVFKLTTNPHACAFGKWYDNFNTDHIALRVQLEKFDSPHRRIHAIGTKVKELEDQGNNDEALKVIESAWNNELSIMRGLFKETKRILLEETNEIIIITEKDERLVGFIVDSVTEVQKIEPDVIEEIGDRGFYQEISDVYGIAKLKDGMCALIDTASLY